MIKTTTTNTTIATITPTLELLSSDCEAESVGELKEVIVCTLVILEQVSLAIMLVSYVVIVVVVLATTAVAVELIAVSVVLVTITVAVH